VRSRGDLLAFADYMLVISNNKLEIDQIVSELPNLQMDWNLRFNKKMLKFLITKDMKEIVCVRYNTLVKYQGLKVKKDK
jgi:hypothetical protein